MYFSKGFGDVDQFFSIGLNHLNLYWNILDLCDFPMFPKTLEGFSISKDMLRHPWLKLSREPVPLVRVRAAQMTSDASCWWANSINSGWSASVLGLCHDHCSIIIWDTTCWFIPRIVIGLVQPSYKWTLPPLIPFYNQGYNPLTKWDEPPSTVM